MGGEAPIERTLAGMPKRRMTEVVGQCQCFSKVFVETKRACERAGDLRDFERMGEPGTEMVALVKDKNLRLVSKAAEGGRMNDPVAIAPEGVSGRTCRLVVKPAAARARVGCIRGAGNC